MDKNSRIGFCGMLTLLLIALKLTHNIDWPWVWVFSPAWIGSIISIIIIAFTTWYWKK